MLILGDSDTRGGEAEELHRLAATVLLGGSVRPSPFSVGIQRSQLDLPCVDGQTLLALWRGHVAAMAAPYQPILPTHLGDSAVHASPLPDSSATLQIAPLIHVLADQDAQDPTGAAKPSGAVRSSDVQIRFDRDPAALRGTGGLLRDISGHYAPEEYLLVANATQILLKPLAEIFACLAAQAADVAVIAHRDGTPATLMLVRCACLRELPEMGFIDMKEQALPLISSHHGVKVVQLAEPICRGIRTAESYIAALKAFHRADGGAGGEVCPGPLSEDWRSDFQIQEDGATVQTGVRLHDSVVLRGAAVGRNAVLVRCVVCPGAVVPPAAVLVDKLVTTGGIRDSSEAAT